ncbi:hypothetical protein GYMLUDRAFT_44978 [Collybiopsis luxurians FD-317 M1]|uniref:HNH nuclease domain-containing protein n=1 Tax=Collybiopsis luxurians FD-317 M1 TaxID=944289 RepID=A0A0D0B6C5_9AGAR|nr:hypothetical protein GYMLUDRAFT_44978 [Collybiopsis luxurians FD-317 M1]
MMSSSPDSPPPGHVWLFLESSPDDPDALFLEIPLERIQKLCLKPCKYLRFLAYAILALDGAIVHSPSTLLADDAPLEDRGIYIFHYSMEITAQDLAKRRADVEVVWQRIRDGGSESSCLNSFADPIMARDAVSLFNSTSKLFTQVMHIVAHARGTPWLLHLIAMRRDFEDGEGVQDLSDIDDPRNGFCGEVRLHPLLDQNICGVLKTPNHILDMNDVPPAPSRSLNSASYPSDVRYTLQYLDDDPAFETDYMPNNTDAAFKPYHDPLLRPSAFLLHYRYGASALVKWGKGLERRIPPSRPAKATSSFDRSVTTDPKVRDERAKQRNLRKDERHDKPGVPKDNPSWTNRAVFEVYDPLDVVKMISPWYDPDIDETFDLDTEEYSQRGGPRDSFADIEEWRNTL